MRHRLSVAELRAAAQQRHWLWVCCRVCSLCSLMGSGWPYARRRVRLCSNQSCWWFATELRTEQCVHVYVALHCHAEAPRISC